jgi:peptide/nickel transport system ATP-binding protein
MTQTIGTEVLLQARGLRAAYSTGREPVVALDGVSLDVHDGEVLGIAGESGCGKSTLAAALSLTARAPLHVIGGQLRIGGNSIDLAGGKTPPRSWRGKVVSLLPQGAMNSLSPTLRIRDFVVDVIRAHEPKVKRADALDRTRARLVALDLPPRVLDAYPHQLSGGMKQRVVTIVSTLLDPTLLIADEPTSALDVSSQRMLIELLQELVRQQIIGGVIFVTHDLPVLRQIATRIAVMYAGRLVEIADTDELINRPRHPYSGALLRSVLVPEPHIRTRRVPGIPGAPPSLINPPSGCRFHPRCEYAMDVCSTEEPPQVGTEQRYAACWWAERNPGKAVQT